MNSLKLSRALRQLQSQASALMWRGVCGLHGRLGKERHVAVVSARPPAAGWRRLARRYGKKIVHMPLKRFGGQLVERLRRFHVLNGKVVRSYAADFIRDS